MAIIKCPGNDGSYHMLEFQRINYLLEHSQNIAMSSVRFKCCAWFSCWAIHYCKTEPLDVRRLVLCNLQHTHPISKWAARFSSSVTSFRRVINFPFLLAVVGDTGFTGPVCMHVLTYLIDSRCLLIGS